MNPYTVPKNEWISTYGNFFKGYVMFIREGLLKGFFSKHKFLLDDGTIIKIGINNYIRGQSTEDLLKGENYFEIIAPIEKVIVLEGNINSIYINYMSVADFHYYRKLNH